MTQAHWRKLNVAWVLFFAAAGLLNIYVAYNFEKSWPTFKVFGLMGLTFAFMIGQTIWMTRLAGDDLVGGEDDREESPDENSRQQERD